MKFTVALVVLALAMLTNAEQFSYRNYKVYQPQFDSKVQRDLLMRWEKVSGVDFWDRAGQRIMIQPDLQERFESFLKINNISYEVIIEDVETTVEAERKYDQDYRRRRSASGRSTIDFEHFWRTQEIYDYMDELAAKYPNLVTVEVVGTTHLNNEIKAITISTNNGQVTGSKQLVFIDGGIHAREWAAIMSVVYLIHELVEHSSQYGNMLEKDWVIIPVANPDGYEHSHTTARMWRKNRFPVSDICTGVDLNRNFAYMWEWDSDSNACSDTFAGESALSEKESQTIAALMSRYASSVTLYLTVHTSGEMILYPYGYSFYAHPIENAAKHIVMGQNALDAILAVGGPYYVVGNSVEISYPVNGASDDHAIGHAGFKYAFTLMLTGGGHQGFDLPAYEIQRVAQETFEIFKSMANDI